MEALLVLPLDEVTKKLKGQGLLGSSKRHGPNGAHGHARNGLPSNVSNDMPLAEQVMAQNMTLDSISQALRKANVAGGTNQRRMPPWASGPNGKLWQAHPAPFVKRMAFQRRRHRRPVFKQFGKRKNAKQHVPPHIQQARHRLRALRAHYGYEEPQRQWRVRDDRHNLMELERQEMAKMERREQIRLLQQERERQAYEAQVEERTHLWQMRQRQLREKLRRHRASKRIPARRETPSRVSRSPPPMAVPDADMRPETLLKKPEGYPTVKVVGIPTKYTSTDILGAFKGHFDVIHVMKKGPDSAYILFRNPGDARRAKRQFDGGEMNDSKITVTIEKNMLCA